MKKNLVSRIKFDIAYTYNALLSLLEFSGGFVVPPLVNVACQNVEDKEFTITGNHE